MRIGIVGGGAVGLTFAARLARANDVVVLVRRAAAARAIVDGGIVVDSDEGPEAPASVEASIDPLALRACDAVIVAVKAFATADALAPLRGVLAPSALVASVQNGIEFVDVARAVLPGARLVAGSTTQGAAVVNDARVRATSHTSTTFGRDDDAAPRTHDLARAFAAAGLDARVVDDIRPVLWRKLAVNAALNPLAALLRLTNGALVADPDLVAAARVLADETAAVAAREGVPVGDAWEAAEAAARATAGNRNSMLQDVEAGRRTEIDAICGAVVRRGAARDVDVTANRMMLRLVRALERERGPREGGPR